MASQILLLISDKRTMNILLNLLRTEGYKVTSGADSQKGAELITSDQFDLMITSAGGTWDPDFNLIKTARSKRPSMRIIALTENDGGATAAKIAPLGIFSTIEKPLKVDKLLAAVQKAVDFSDASMIENVNLNLQLETLYQYDNIVAESPAMKAVCGMISRVAGTDIAVLISGEHGTGKGSIAHAIFGNSLRKNGKFITVDCSTPDVEVKLFGAADGKGAMSAESNGNTLYLREVGSLPLTVQVKLLPVLQDRKLPVAAPGEGVPLDMRIISSCSGNIEQQVVKGTFKSDLYKLLRVISIKVPPLRDRPQDVMPILRQVLRKKCKGQALPTLSGEAVRLLEKYSWPGNIKEIENVVEHAVAAAQGKAISKEHLPPEIISSK
jgi:two-component system, NtrC family, response regulator PilR